MSASEKLKALDWQGLQSWARATLESAALRPAQDGAWYKHAAIKVSEKSLPLADALPQIVAVVKSAEAALPENEQWDIDQDCVFCRGHYGDHYPECIWKQGRAALAALDKTLT